jgi:hypothetical protein
MAAMRHPRLGPTRRSGSPSAHFVRFSRRGAVTDSGAPRQPWRATQVRKTRKAPAAAQLITRAAASPRRTAPRGVPYRERASSARRPIAMAGGCNAPSSYSGLPPQVGGCAGVEVVSRMPTRFVPVRAAENTPPLPARRRCIDGASESRLVALRCRSHASTPQSSSVRQTWRERRATVPATARTPRRGTPSRWSCSTSCQTPATAS